MACNILECTLKHCTQTAYVNLIAVLDEMYSKHSKQESLKIRWVDNEIITIVGCCVSKLAMITHILTYMLIV